MDLTSWDRWYGSSQQGESNRRKLIQWRFVKSLPVSWVSEDKVLVTPASPLTRPPHQLAYVSPLRAPWRSEWAPKKGKTSGRFERVTSHRSMAHLPCCYIRPKNVFPYVLIVNLIRCGSLATEDETVRSRSKNMGPAALSDQWATGVFFCENCKPWFCKAYYNSINLLQSGSQDKICFQMYYIGYNWEYIFEIASKLWLWWIFACNFLSIFQNVVNI